MGLYHFKGRPPRGAGTGTRTALFLLHLSNLRKPRVRKHKVFSKLVNRPLKRSQRSQQPGDKVPSHYHSIDRRDFAYLTGISLGFFDTGHYASSVHKIHQHLANFLFSISLGGKCLSLATHWKHALELNYMSAQTNKLEQRFKVNCFTHCFYCISRFVCVRLKPHSQETGTSGRFFSVLTQKRKRLFFKKTRFYLIWKHKKLKF